MRCNEAISVGPHGPTDPTPRTRVITLDLANGDAIEAADDAYSDRIRCDHPDTRAGQALGEALLQAAVSRGRGRVVVLCDSALSQELHAAELTLEATMPGFYRGERDCAVMGAAPDEARSRLANPQEVEEVDRLVQRDWKPKDRPDVDTRRATPDDAPEIARLIAATFEHYPTPSGVPGYIAGHIEAGVPFRTVWEDGEVVACASADLVRQARTAELTDCATRPDQRGRGLMQAILLDLMDDLREMGYPTAFTLARANTPGMNIAFSRLGFIFRGCQIQSCRIGGGIEDMNVWSRRL